VPYLGPVPRAHLQEELQRFAKPAADAGLETRVRLLEGNATRSILEEARDAGADLIVLGTHGREGFERLVLGSVAEKVLRQAACPVLTVGQPAAGPPPGPPLYGRILCAVDFSRCSLRALDYALSLAQEAKALLHVLHVLEWAPDQGIREHAAPDPGLGDFLVREATQRLREAIPEEARDWCRPEEIVSTGKPYAAILREAREKGSELIVMGVRGRGALDLALFGSTTHHVVRQAPCPVLTIRESEREK
jgi:nucleotide-binding universal stress UspA family protein